MFFFDFHCILNLPHPAGIHFIWLLHKKCTNVLCKMRLKYMEVEFLHTVIMKWKLKFAYVTSYQCDIDINQLRICTIQTY